MVGQLDAVVGYAGVHAFRKLWLGYSSEVLANAKLAYQEHYER
jgi:hypothetical protein